MSFHGVPTFRCRRLHPLSRGFSGAHFLFPFDGASEAFWGSVGALCPGQRFGRLRLLLEWTCASRFQHPVPGPIGFPFGLPSGDGWMVSSITVTVTHFFGRSRFPVTGAPASSAPRERSAVVLVGFVALSAA